MLRDTVFTLARAVDDTIKSVAYAHRRLDKLEAEVKNLQKCCDGGPQWGHAYNCPKGR